VARISHEHTAPRLAGGAPPRTFVARLAAALAPSESTRLAPEAGGEGIGLGLALVRQIVAQHGGRVWVDSVPGEGATFWVSLPRRQRQST